MCAHDHFCVTKYTGHKGGERKDIRRDTGIDFCTSRSHGREENSNKRNDETEAAIDAAAGPVDNNLEVRENENGAAMDSRKVKESLHAVFEKRKRRKTSAVSSCIYI